MRTSIARLTAGTLVVLAACTGSPSSTSPPGRTSGAASPPPSTSGIARLADGQPLPTGCPTGTAARDETVAFVADGNAWVLDPASGDVSCLFAAPAPGPFTWNPRGDRALLNDLEIRSIHGVQLRAASPLPAAVTSWGHPIGKAVVYISPSGTRLRKIYSGNAASRRHHSGRPCPLPERHLPPVRSRHRVRGRHGGRGGDLALVEPRRGPCAARVRGRRNQVRRARLHARTGPRCSTRRYTATTLRSCTRST